MLSGNNNNQIISEEIRLLTSQFWEEWLRLSIARFAAYQNYKRTGIKKPLYVIDGIIQYLGYKSVLSVLKYNSFNEAKSNWNDLDGRFKYLHKKPKRISELSSNQIQLLNKFSIK